MTDTASEIKQDLNGDDDLTIPESDKAVRARNMPDSSYQNYLFGSAGASDTPAWSDSTTGRAAIRVLSRGVVGAAFFTIGGRMATKQLRGYNQEDWKWDSSKPLQAIAKGIDATLGRAIQGSVRGLAKLRYSPEQAAQIGKDAVTFRNSRHYVDSRIPFGRSYGADIVGFTFDFAMASVGDAGTRNIIQAIDPNVKKAWLLNDKGEPAAKGEHKHIDWGKWAKAVGKTSWRIASKNQGEDWAAAIPYAFQMKFQRQFLSNVFNRGMDGHQMVFDHSWNGGAFRVNQQGKIVGDYQLAGAIDLHARFVGYNWYTLMFREGYDTIGNAFKQWKDEGFAIRPHLPEHVNPLTAAVDGVGSSLRYVMKSFIKANMYMNPAVIPFWLIRVPQSKWRGEHFINDANRAEFIKSSGENAKVYIDPSRPSDPSALRLNPFDKANYAHYDTSTTLGKVEKTFSRVLNPIGFACDAVGGKAAKLSDKIAAKGWWPKNGVIGGVFAKDAATGEVLASDRRKFMREYLDASLSYTPYMWAKAETALRVDDSKGDGKPGQMDQAIYHFMDHVAAFKVGELGKDIKQMWTLGTNFERDVKVREGGDIDSETQEVVKSPATKPTTTVQVSSVMRQHDPVNLARADAANDAPAADSANTSRWAHAVAANEHSFRLSGNATRH